MSFTNFLSILWLALRKMSIPGVLVIVYRETKGRKEFLFVRSSHTGAVTFVSGTLELGEDFDSAASRELYEEVGIKARHPISLPIIHEFKYRNLLIKFRSFQQVFLVKTNKRVKIKPKDKNIKEFGWYSQKEAIKSLSYPELKRTFLKIIDFLKKERNSKCIGLNC